MVNFATLNGKNKKMKKIFCFLSLVAILLAACATTGTQRKSKSAQKAETAQIVRQNVENKHFRVDVKWAYPMEGQAISLTSVYSLELKGDSVISYLPYYGRAYSIPYGGGKALNFEGTAKDYRVTSPKKDLMRVFFLVTNDEDTYEYTLDIFVNGNTTIFVQPQRRNSINFSGEVVTDR
jgi:hypothetical protein